MGQHSGRCVQISCTFVSLVVEPAALEFRLLVITSTVHIICVTHGTPLADTDDSAVPREADPATGVVVETEPQPGTMDALPKESLCHLAVGSAVTCTYNGKEARLVKPVDQPSTLDGYTFNLACKFESKKGKIENVRFLFTLCAGNEDDLVSWPFAKKVSLRIVDAANQGKDVGVTFKMRPEEDAECFRRPVAHALQKGILSEKVSWKQVNKRKLVRDDVLTVAVQFQ